MEQLQKQRITEQIEQKNREAKEKEKEKLLKT
jgi:hypothetical protein